MVTLKAGTRLRSAVCSTEVMVISAPGDGADIRCGGTPMIGMDEQPPEGAALDPAASAGAQLGKRYVNEAGDLELLCTKPGEGSLAQADTALVLKEAKPLPSSD